MRLIKLTGGLGNQMFIYACYLQMRQRHSHVRVDLSDIMHYKAHNGYELRKVFDLNEGEFCWPQWLKKVVEFLFFKVILERKQNLETMEAYKCKYSWPLIYFKGFYQSERFFDEVKDEVRKAFHFNLDKANDYSREMAKRIKADEHSVSFHVRRGDYMNPKFYENMGSVCQLSYYENAVKKILEIDPQAHFYIFSDDTDWVKENLKLPQTTIIDGNKGADSWQDMMLMSFCHHNVICNSTFSWWGAWLNSHADKKVIAPNRWYGLHEAPYIIPKEWIKVATK